MCLKAEVLDNKGNATITFFNNLAERLIGESCDFIRDMKGEDDIHVLYEKVKKRIYKFTVSGGRKEDEYFLYGIRVP